MSYYQYTCDHALEQKYAAILDHDLYIESMGFTNSHRNVDRNTQKLGVDIEFDFAGRHYVCDEKAATSYGVNVSDNSGRTLSTYSFELFTTEGN